MWLIEGKQSQQSSSGENSAIFAMSVKLLFGLQIHLGCWLINYSGVARLGHTGARALATGGRAPPVQVRV